MKMKTNKFKVGDLVRVLDGRQIVNYLCGWTDSMNQYVGKAFKIIDLDVFDDGVAYCLKNTDGHYFDERGLEFAEICFGDEICIGAIGNRVTMAKDMKTGTTAYARCSPEDTFDFKVGAKLALDRLFELRNTKAKFKVGDRIVGNVLANKYNITKERWFGEVIRVNNANGLFDARSFETGGEYHNLRDDRFDLCNYRVVPGDIVKVNEAIYGPVENKLKIEMATKLTTNPEYLARLDFGSNFLTLKAFERTKIRLKVIAANEKFAMVAEDDLGSTYIIGIKGLIRCL